LMALACSALRTSSVTSVPLRASAINQTRRNERYLPDYRLPRNVRAAAGFDAIDAAELLLLAVPSHSVEGTCRLLRPRLRPGAAVLNLAKGLHPEFITMNTAIERELPDAQVGALKGPTFARPLLHGSPSGMTLALADAALQARVMALFAGSSAVLERWASVGDVEFVGGIKNVLAIAVGICDAIEENPNTRFLVIKEVINEAHALLVHFGFDPGVLLTYAGLGDLLMTGLNDTSRNRTLGLLIGRGFEFAHQVSGPVLEGRRSTSLLCSRLPPDGTGFPVVRALSAVFEQQLSPQQFHNRITGGRDTNA
jgi:glycerol-3-phosphate dehydrogenase (NAD(P)+)